MPFFNLMALLLIFTGITACQPATPTPEPFKAPTVIVPPAPPTLTPAPTSITPLVTPAPKSCTNNLSYIEDVNIPDGSEVLPGVPLIKQWKVKNSGDCNWNDQYHLKFINGTEMGAEPEQALYPARTDSEAIITLRFTSPPEAGTYYSTWQAHDPTGLPFGDPIYIEFVVNPDLTPTAQP